MPLFPMPIKPGSPKREHYEYVRNGTCCIFLAFEPRAGKRMVCVKEHRTKADYADFMKNLANQYSDAQTILLVQDNLNTHTACSFYEALPPEEAFEPAKRFEYHYTPKKGNWLNMAEIELSALSKQCLDRRIANIEMLAGEVSAWEHDRNAVGATVKWKFNKCNARKKLQRYYSNCKINVTEH
jgi:hypothetical protein